MKTTILPVLLAALVLAISAFPAAAAPSLAEALDNAELLFTTVGDGEWYGQTDASHDGVDAARSGPLLDGQVTWLQTTVNGPGTLSFWWNVSSEEGADPFELYADGERLDAISGTNGVWRRKSIRMTGGGPHDVIWTDLKDEEVYLPGSMVWLKWKNMLCAMSRKFGFELNVVSSVTDSGSGTVKPCFIRNCFAFSI